MPWFARTARCSRAVAAACRHGRRHASSVRIACASGFWGDTACAVPQLIHGVGQLDFLVFDYLSEVTMSLLTAAQRKNPALGYAQDFVLHSLAPHLADIKRKGIRVISNAGGMNTSACAAAIELACRKSGVDLKVAQVTGDDLFSHSLTHSSLAHVRELHTGMPLPDTVSSMTAYFGAGPVVKALEMGADIVITGRIADSALALAPCVHQLKWSFSDWDKLAVGSLAGHLIECGAQATGGTFTDWATISGYHNLGFPIVQVDSHGEIRLSKPQDTGGAVTEATVAEQLLYEVGDPRNYILPDVICDFSRVTVRQVGQDEVVVRGATGRPPTDHFKVCATYLSGFKSSCVAIVGGGRAAAKAQTIGDAIMKRVGYLLGQLGMEPFTQSEVSVIGGADADAVALWLAVQHPDKKAIEIWSREIAPAGTGMPPGMCNLVGGRPKPSPCFKLFSFLYPKAHLPAKVSVGQEEVVYHVANAPHPLPTEDPLPEEDSNICVQTGSYNYTLEDVAFTRSGDKGDTCNIGVIARHPAYLPYIRHHVTCESVGSFLQGFLQPNSSVRCYSVPGVHGLNFVLDNALGGGGMASLRPDPLGKSYGQRLLALPLRNMPHLERLRSVP